MTRAQAAITLRELQVSVNGDGGCYRDALAVAIRALEPKQAKPRKPKLDGNLKAFLAIRFPQPSYYAGPSNAHEVEAKLSPEARAQFRYGTTGARKLDKAVLLAAKVSRV